jgi:hypothetical protein
MGDRFCLPLARRDGLPAITADRQWRTIADTVEAKIIVIRRLLCKLWPGKQAQSRQCRQPEPSQQSAQALIWSTEPSRNRAKTPVAYSMLLAPRSISKGQSRSRISQTS